MNTRVLSAVEFLLGAFVVIGHNVFRILPNEVPILVVLCILSVRLRNGSLSAIGFKRPESWTRILIIALAAAAVRTLIGEYVIPPITAHFWSPSTGPAEAENITGNIKFALLALLIVWTLAAFGEEISYRGYLLTRAAESGGGSRASYFVVVVLTSILFGFGHYYKGPAGVVDSGVAGLILGTAYLFSGRNLWTTILAHGFIDTFGVVMIFFGWAQAD